MRKLFIDAGKASPKKVIDPAVLKERILSLLDNDSDNRSELIELSLQQLLEEIEDKGY